MVLPNNTGSIKSKELVSFYASYKDCFKVAHINIKSVRHKFQPTYDVVRDGLIDMVCVQESKLDDSFPQSQFEVPGYKV